MSASQSLFKSLRLIDISLKVFRCEIALFFYHFENRVNSSGSQKAADSNVALRMNISAPVRSSDSAKISKNVASLVD